jgi:heterodisulfide reductase subunit C
MAEEMPLGPHEMIRLVQLDRRQQLLRDESLWLCLTCETCTTRCPNQVDPARLIDALREIALGESDPAVGGRLAAFHRSFLDQVRSHGRVFELGMLISYKLRTGALFDDMALGPATLVRGKLKLRPTTIAGAEDVARIFAACEQEPAP